MANKLARGNHRILTNPVRLSYAQGLFKKAQEGEINAGKYSVTLLIDKNDKETLDLLNKEFEAIKEEAINNPKLFKNKKLPVNFRIPLRDGDIEASDQNVNNYKGYMFMSAKNERDVVLQDTNGMSTNDDSVIYSGCWCLAIIELFAYSQNGASGISCKIQGVKKVKDDASFGGGEIAVTGDEFGGSDFEDEFEDL